MRRSWDINAGRPAVGTRQPAVRGRRAALLAAAALLVTVVGCYKPKIGSGQLSCALPPGKACPDGLRCVDGLCVTGGVAGGSGGAGGVRDAAADAPPDTAPAVDAAADAGAADTGAADLAEDRMEMCVTPRPGCSAHAGTCDPFCQSGCDGCREKCSVNTAGVLICTTAARRPRLVGETCLVSNRGAATQGDECAPGLVCIEDCGGGGGARCYQFCRTDIDCPQSACTRVAAEANPTVRVCDVPFVACNPQDGHQGCSNPAQDCYLLSADSPPPGRDIAERTVCDCSMGALGIGQPCSDSRDCLRGLVCPTSGLGSGYCRRVCDPAAASTGCQGTQCRRYGDTWGYCM